MSLFYAVFSARLRYEIRMYYAEVLIGWALRLMPYGPEKMEFAAFITSCWMQKLLRERAS